jgi:membrane protein
VGRPTTLDRVRFAWHDVRSFAGRVLEGAGESNVPFLASGLTFDALLAAVPFMLLLLSVIGYVLSAEAGRAQVAIHDYIQRFFPSVPINGTDPFAPVMRLVERIVLARGKLTVVAIPAFVWFSTRLFGSLRAALNEVFDVEDPRPWLRGKLDDVVLVLVTTSLFVINAALSQGVALLARYQPYGLGFLEYFGAQVLAFFLLVALFAIVFRYAPAHRLRRGTALVAALICAFGFEMAKTVLGFWIERMVNPNEIVRDATIAGVLLFVLWTYYMMFVFLIGGQIAQVYDLRRRQSQQRWLLN